MLKTCHPDIHKDYNNKHKINVIYLITDWKKKVKLIVLYSLNARADFLFVKYYKYSGYLGLLELVCM